MKENIIIIYQDEWSKRISKVEKAKGDVSLPTSKYCIDCDEDSVLIQGNFPPDPELGRIMSSDDVTFGAELIPVIAADPEGKILMQAFTNKEALDMSFSKGVAHYFSRSKNRLWMKGESSGHTQEISQIEYSNLYGYIVIRVKQNKAACHTGYYTCFYRELVAGASEKIISTIIE